MTQRPLLQRDWLHPQGPPDLGARARGEAYCDLVTIFDNRRAFEEEDFAACGHRKPDVLIIEWGDHTGQYPAPFDSKGFARIQANTPAKGPHALAGITKMNHQLPDYKIYEKATHINPYDSPWIGTRFGRLIEAVARRFDTPEYKPVVVVWPDLGMDCVAVCRVPRSGSGKRRLRADIARAYRTLVLGRKILTTAKEPAHGPVQ